MQREKWRNQENWQLLSVAFEPPQRLVLTLQPPQIWNELQEVSAVLLVLPSPCQGDLKFFLLLYHCILLLNLHEHVAGGVLLLAAASVADGALPCHWSRRPGQHPQVPSHNFSMAYKMFAHKLPSGAWSLVSPCRSWPSPSSASPWCCSSLVNCPTRWSLLFIFGFLCLGTQISKRQGTAMY